ncbi:MAG TPA: serine/threonine-protein kinase [Polyangiaceae bacterium]|nr:serine/threonine-protein kinase [Polyangiaceae bacterium]
MSLKIGDRIDGKYEIKRLLGEGGMGAVYEGENTLIHRRVAIKVLHSGVAALEEAVKRFENEAQAAGRIGSDHIVEVLDLGRLDSGDRYMVMEFLKGESLSARIAARGRLSATEISHVGLQLLEGLSAAHEAGIIHRDLKPDNIFLIAQAKGRTDFVKILDFGISKFNALGKDFSMTRTGSVMGTPYYMAPEQARGAKNLDARLDVYAAGVILYEAATGRVPFDGDTFNELLIKIVTEDSPPVRSVVPDLDPGLAEIIDKARQKNPDQRFASAREFREALASWSEGARSALATGATIALAPPPPASPGADTALAGGAGLASRDVIPARAEASPAAVNATAAFAPPAQPVALGNRTGQAWANTQAALPPSEPRARTGRNVFIAGGTAVALAVVVLVVKLQSDAASSAAQAAATSASVGRQLQEAREEAAQKLAEEQARTRELEAKQEARRLELEQAQAQAAARERAAEEERQRAEAAKAKTEAQRPRPKAPAAARSSAAAGGRRIRTSL